MVTTPPSFGTRGILILDIDIATYSIYRFKYFFSLFYSTGEAAEVNKPGGVLEKSNGLQHQKRKLAIFLSYLLDKGVTPQKASIDPTVAFSRRCRRRAAALPDPAPIQACHWDTHHMIWQGLQTSTGNPGGGPRRVGSLVTEV